MFSDPIKNLANLDIQNGMSIVDIGSGSGFYTLEAAKKVGGSGRVYSVDVQRDILDRIKNSAATLGMHNIEIIWANAEKIGGTKLREACEDFIDMCDHPEDFLLGYRKYSSAKKTHTSRKRTSSSKEATEDAVPLLGEDIVA